MPTKKLVTQSKFRQDIPEDEIVINGPLLVSLMRQNVLRWLLRAAALFAVVLFLLLLLLPQQFTAVTSIAVQQSSTPSTLLNVLGGTPADSRYIGILKSRMAAEQVESAEKLQDLYHLRTHAEAIDLLMRSVKPEMVATDGLLYVNVTLPAPAHLSFGEKAHIAQIKQTSADVANLYAGALRVYYDNDDTDRESVLLRAADSEETTARSDYDQAMTVLLDYVRTHDVDPHSKSLANADPSNPGTTELSALYTSLYQVQEQIRQDEAEQSEQTDLQSQQLNKIASLPAEDPLLTDARKRVSRDESDLAAATSVYGPDNPHVVSAQNQLKVDQSQLADQTTGVRGNLTTDQVTNAAKLKGLYASRDQVQTQIIEAEQRMRSTRDTAGEFARLQQEVSFRAGTLATISAEAAKVRMENVSSKSRMQIIDTAIPPKKSSPGMLVIIAIAVIITFLWLFFKLLREYLRQQNLQTSPSSVKYLTNGTSGEHLTEPARIS